MSLAVLTNVDPFYVSEVKMRND